MNPPEDERKCNHHGHYAAPEQKLMHPPPHAGPFEDKRLPDHMRAERLPDNPKAPWEPLLRTSSKLRSKKRRVGGLLSHTA